MQPNDLAASSRTTGDEPTSPAGIMQVKPENDTNA